MGKILVVDDDKNILKVIRMRLESRNHLVTTANQTRLAIKTVKDNIFDLALVDLKLNEDDGIELMEEFHRINPEMPVIILTAYGTIKNAVEAMKRGAYGYLTKPFDNHELVMQINKCLEKNKLSTEAKALKNIVKKKFGFDDIIGRSEKMKKVLEEVVLAAETDSFVYIEGKSGTGKELIAKSLHLASSRRKAPFVAINCAAIPENLLESELFGHEKGSFTGAIRSKKGLLEQADKGTFFLDEISEMPLSMQAKLLRVLEEKEFYPLGGTKTIRINCKFIAASNKKLKEKIEKGEFREDLFYRIHVIPIKLPSLCERKEDIPVLAKHFLEKYAKTMKKNIKGFTPSAMQKLLLHPWPGNVRELENTIECAVTMVNQDMITEDLILKTHDLKGTGFEPLKNAKECFEKNYLVQLLEITDGNISQAAKLAGKYRADLYELLKKYDLKPSDFRKNITVQSGLKTPVSSEAKK